MKIRDQADQYGCERTGDAVRAYQDDLMAVISARTGQHRARQADGRPVPLYVSTNRWVADCPECGAGIECSDWNPEATCLGCGHVYTLERPAGLADAITLLEARPDGATRNWSPHKSETVAGLAHENETFMGITVATDPVDPSTYQSFVVAARFADHHDGARYTGTGPETELLGTITDGYTVHWDDESGLALVTIKDQPTAAVAERMAAMGGGTVEDLTALDPTKTAPA